MDLIVCMSIAGSIPVLLCFLLFLIQRDSYNFLWGRKLLLAGVFFFLAPVQLVRFLLPMDILPEPVFSEETQFICPILWIFCLDMGMSMCGSPDGFPLSF